MKISLGCDHGGYALKEHIKGLYCTNFFHSFPYPFYHI